MTCGWRARGFGKSAHAEELGRLLVLGLTLWTSGAFPSDVEARGLPQSAESQDSAPLSTRSPGEPTRSVEVGGTYSRGYTSGEFFRFRFWEPREYAVALEVGGQHGFGASDVGLGAIYSRTLDDDSTLSVGGGTGKGPFFPRWAAGVSFRKPLSAVGVSVGYDRRQWEGGVHWNAVTVGADRWFSHWIVSGNARYTWGEPGRFQGLGGGLGLTYYVWRRSYVGMGFDLGNERREDLISGLHPRSVNASYSRWLDDSSGVNVRVDHAWSTYAGRISGVTASWFKEW